MLPSRTLDLHHQPSEVLPGTGKHFNLRILEVAMLNDGGECGGKQADLQGSQAVFCSGAETEPLSARGDDSARIARVRPRLDETDMKVINQSRQRKRATGAVGKYCSAG